MSIVIAILIFSAIILFHELGHFLLAKKNGIEVVEFSLGMGPRLLSRQWGGTRYSLRLLPLGGACEMLGEDTDSDVPGTFNAASVWGRIAVVAAGPCFNFILAFFAALLIIALIGYTPSAVASVEESSPAWEAGLRPGDQITEFDGYGIDIGKDLTTYLAVRDTPELVQMKVKRSGETLHLTFRPEYEERYMLGFNHSAEPDQPLEVLSLIKGLPMEETGIVPGDVITSLNGTAIADSGDYDQYIEKHPLTDGDTLEIGYEHNGKSRTASITPAVYRDYSLGFQCEAARERGSAAAVLKYSLLEVKYWIRTTILSLRELIGGRFGLRDLSGPVGVVNVIGDTYEASRSEGIFWVFINMLNMAVLLSANLGVMNLLPIPALDGGRLVFLLIEAVLRRPVNREAEGMVHFAGFVMLMLLMAVVMYNDILRIL